MNTWVAFRQEIIVIIGEHRENYVRPILLEIGIISVNGDMVVAMYGAGPSGLARTQIVTVGDGFGSNFTVILSRFTSYGC
jgi:hypothetical protein